MALVGSYVGASRLLVAVLPVFLLAWLRFGIAAVAMLHWVRRRPGEPPLSPQDRRLLFWESFLGNFLFSICMLYGVLLTSAVSAGVVMAAIPAAVALLSRWWLGERISRRTQAAIACAGLGILRAGAGPRAGRQPAGRSARRPGPAGPCAAAGRGVLRGGLCGDRQTPDRQRVAAAHQRADQPVGPGPGHAAGPVAGLALRLRCGAGRHLVAAVVLCPGRQHGHGVAVDAAA